MTFSILICLVSFVALIWMLRAHQLSMGFPIAYLFSLLLIHVPGALAHVVGGDILPDSRYTQIGIRFTAIASACFVVGVWLARLPALRMPPPRAVNRHDFWLFCLIAGWAVTYGFSLLRDIPSVAAALEKGGAAWMLGVLLGLRSALRRGDARWVTIWLGCLAVYPAISLLIGGFLSYGTTAVVIVLAALAVSTRNTVRVSVGVVAVAVLAFHLFLSYFEHRNDIRQAVWGGAPLAERLDATSSIFSDVRWFDPTDQQQLFSLDVRLNQNYFVGVAAARIEDSQVEYLRGRSIWEGLMALVPRAVWAEKPVYGGSPKIVAEMTGLELAENTSWGVGNVMEFQINFGTAGVVIGFLALGWAIGILDRRAAIADASGNLGQIFIYFIPAVALVQPNSSLVELSGGAAAGLVAAWAWRWAWHRWSPPPLPSSMRPRVPVHRSL